MSCGQCSFVCPAGAITVNSSLNAIDELLKIKKKNKFILVVSTAPAVRVTISEEWGKKPNTLGDTKMVAALKKLGFDYVFDTLFTADLTIMEEGNELIERINNGGPFPMFTSCCPAWINYVELHEPQFRKNLSTCKSPQQMMGAVVKSYWARKMKLERSQVVYVSIMPCVAKKDEIKRHQMAGDVDFVLSTRELARLLKRKKINPFELKDIKYDDPLGEGTGAANLFGASGGVMEAALRTAYEVLEKKPCPSIDFKQTRGIQGIKIAEIPIVGINVKIAIAHSGKNIRELLQRIKDGEQTNRNLLQTRINAIYKLDSGKKNRKSHTNVSVQKIYTDFLKKPLGYYSKRFLHTHYEDRSGETSKGKKID